VVLGASFDDEAANAAFAKKFAFPFALLCDVDRKLGLAYGACDDAKAGYAKRISVLIDERGNVAKFYPKVQPADHPAEVLADVG
jgi:thioredoxin-dependent peroxiredoxin